jgi:hypothetical protein
MVVKELAVSGRRRRGVSTTCHSLPQRRNTPEGLLEVYGHAPDTGLQLQQFPCRLELRAATACASRSLKGLHPLALQTSAHQDQEELACGIYNHGMLRHSARVCVIGQSPPAQKSK